jgi:hypothetical protein
MFRVGVEVEVLTAGVISWNDLYIMNSGLILRAKQAVVDVNSLRRLSNTTVRSNATRFPSERACCQNGEDPAKTSQT